jgi:hypothetical protein
MKTKRQRFKLQMATTKAQAEFFAYPAEMRSGRRVVPVSVIETDKGAYK